MAYLNPPAGEARENLGAAADLLAAIPVAAITSLGGTVGTANDTMTAIAAPTDSPADADALRDDIAAVMVPAINNNLADLQAKVNAILTALRNAGIIET
jgi:hypothetical protein